MSNERPRGSFHRAPHAVSAARYTDALGPRAGFIGDETGTFEAWIWPIKIGREFRLSFCPEGRSHAIDGRSCATTFQKTPYSATTRHAHEDFTVDATFFADAVERRLFLTLDVKTKRPLTIVWSFEPVFFPMWPAGFGGQIVRNDEATGAILLAEELGRFAALIGSADLAGRVRIDRGLPKEPIALEFTVTPERARRGPVLVLIAGAEVARAALAEGAVTGQAAAATGTARLEKAILAARALFVRTLAEDPKSFLDRRKSAAEDVPAVLGMRSTDPRLEAVIDDAAWAIRNAAVEIDGLGKGLVAGIGSSGAGFRPGFAWYFDGDAMIAGDAMLELGDSQTAREVLSRAASHQRADGKLMHELTLSANICRWFDDYPYAYYKCENTSAFLVYLGRYVRATGDVDFAETLADTAHAAARWIMAQIDSDGFFSLLSAGLGAVEAGPLQKELRSEIYTQGFAIAALSAYLDLGFADSDDPSEANVRTALERLETAFERYWSDGDDRYGFARLRDGRITNDLSAYLGLPLALGAGRPERRARTIRQLNRPAVSSDWGARMFAVDSPIYDPAHYNTGSVFPYLSGFVVTAMYAAGFLPGAHQSFFQLLALGDLEGDGFIPEHLVGDRCVTPERGVPHQIFSSSEIIHAALRGLLGIEKDAPDDFLWARPALPLSWTFIEVEGLRLAERLLSLRIDRTRTDRRTTRYRVAIDEKEARHRPGNPPSVDLRLRVPLGTRLSAEKDGASLKKDGLALSAAAAWKSAPGRLGFEIELIEGPSLETPERPLERGEASERPRIVAMAEEADGIQFTIAGRAGRRERFSQWSDRPVIWEGVAKEGSSFIEVDFPETVESDWVERRVFARFGG